MKQMVKLRYYTETSKKVGNVLQFSRITFWKKSRGLYIEWIQYNIRSISTPKLARKEMFGNPESAGFENRITSYLARYLHVNKDRLSSIDWLRLSAG